MSPTEIAATLFHDQHFMRHLLLFGEAGGLHPERRCSSVGRMFFGRQTPLEMRRRIPSRSARFAAVIEAHRVPPSVENVAIDIQCDWTEFFEIDGA